MNRFPHELSGGEMQRVAIARALSLNPPILLADEPTGNLDSNNSEQVIMLFKEIQLKFNQTIIMATHDLQIAKYGDRIINMKDGEITNEWTNLQ